MKVSVEMPDAVWGRLASMAEVRGVSVGDLVGDAVKGLMKPARSSRSLPLADEARRVEVRTLHELGWSVPEIARRLNRKGDVIRATIADLGLTKEKQ